MHNGSSRRAFLAAMGSTGALVACSSGDVVLRPGPKGTPAVTASAQPSPSPSATPNITPVAIPLTIDASKTDLPAGTAVYAYVIGLVKAGGDQYFYRLDASGTPHPLSMSDNAQAAGTFPGSAALSSAAAAAIAPNYPSAWADYSIPVSLTAPTQISLANVNATTIPMLGTGTAAFSGRIYISVGVPKLPFTVTAGGYTAPVFLTAPGSLTLYDWIEFSYDSTGAFDGNTTQVNQYGFSLTLDGTPGGTAQGTFSASRPSLVAAAAMANASMSTATSTVSVPAAAAAYPAGLTVLRAIAPLTTNASPADSFSTYFDAAIAAAYTLWGTTPVVTHEQSTGAYYTGYVPSSGPSAGVLVFVAGNHPALADASGQPTAFTVPAAGGVIPSDDGWQCANSLASGSADQKNVQKQIGAMFNRGQVLTTIDDALCAAASTFYPSGSTNNAWAKTFHRASTNGLAYGFPYDDVCSQSTSLGIAGTQSITITLGKFFS